MNHTTHFAGHSALPYTFKPARVTRYCMAILLGLSSAFAASQSATAVEVSFFAPVPLTVSFCNSGHHQYCGNIPSTLTGRISGTIEIVDPLSDFSDVIFSPTNVAVSAPFPTVEMSGVMTASYIAPTHLGGVGEMTFSHYEFVEIGHPDWDSLVLKGIWRHASDVVGIVLAEVVAGPIPATTNFVYAIPEPSTFLLLSMAGLGAVVAGPARVRRRHRN
jgi:hypothetical protein